MKADVIPLPATGWSVRGGAWRAHWLYWARGRHASACGGIERIEQYRPQRLRPRQADKPRCMACEARLARAKVGT